MSVNQTGLNYNIKKQVLFSSTEISPISYSTQTLNSKEKNFRKLNTDDLDKIKKIKFALLEKIHLVEKIIQEHYPEINKKRLDNDIDIDIEIHPIKKKWIFKKSTKRN